MVKNQHEKITGYRDLTKEEIDLMNTIKGHEATTADLVAKSGLMGGDTTCLLSAQRKFVEGYMWLVRSVAKPNSPWAGLTPGWENSTVEQTETTDE